MTSRTRRLIAIASCGLAASGLAACGSSDDNEAKRATPPVSNIGSPSYAANTSTDVAALPQIEIPKVVPVPEPGVANPGDQCVGTDAVPNAGNVDAIIRAVICLHNAERTSRGLAPLKPEGRLASAALGHTRDMVRFHYFAHDSRDGRKFSQRVLATGYGKNVIYRIGENLGWGSGNLASPREMVRAWMNSPLHRANLLNSAFREIGIGLVPQAPTADGEGATFTVEFGVRTPIRSRKAK
jgi:uncharacterized protein YkwD